MALKLPGTAALILTALALVSCEKTDPPAATPPAAPGVSADSPEVPYAAQRFVIRLVSPHLHRPSLATFPRESIRFSALEPFEDEHGTTERWSVSGPVFDRDSGGATLESEWQMVLGRSQNNFLPLVVSFNGNEVFRQAGYVDPPIDDEVVESK